MPIIVRESRSETSIVCKQGNNDRYFLKISDLNFRMKFVVALCRESVLTTQKIASRFSPEMTCEINQVNCYVNINQSIASKKKENKK